MLPEQKNSAPDPDYPLYRPLLETGKGFYITVGVLFSIWLWGVFAYYTQVKTGLGVTYMNRPVYWGVYITNFVFFIGISHAGTLISAILRLAQAEWRRAITRMAETITVLVLFFGVGNIIVDLGRPDRVANVLKHGRFQSPLLWDVTSISVYLTCSSIYLFVPLIPDLAILREKVRRGSWRWWLYRTLSLGWTGTHRQHRILDVSISILAVLVIPIAVSVHTVVSFVFSMTIQPMWHSAIFGPYFVAGAIFSGIAALIIAMAVLRRVYKLHDYIKDVHFNYLGILLFVMTLLWFYFTFAEYLTTFYGNEPVHMTIFWEKLAGRFAWPFWAMVAFCFVIPFIFLCNRRTRTVAGTVVASTAVIIGMWLERFIIVVPTLANPRLPYERGLYLPTWVEWSVTAGCFAAFTLLYVLFAKLFPMVSIWEIKEGREVGLVEAEERLRSYLPHLEAPAFATGSPGGAAKEGST